MSEKYFDIESPEDWYDSLGYHIGSTVHPVVEFDDFENLNEEELFKKAVNSIKSTENMNVESIAESMLEYARCAREAAITIMNSLDSAIEAVEKRDWVKVREEHNYASREEWEWGDDPACYSFRKGFESITGIKWEDFPFEPDFGDVEDGLIEGIYGSKYVNPPSGDDCVRLRVREDGTLGWADSDGDSGDCEFSVSELCSSD